MSILKNGFDMKVRGDFKDYEKYRFVSQEYVLQRLEIFGKILYPCDCPRDENYDAIKCKYCDLGCRFKGSPENCQLHEISCYYADNSKVFFQTLMSCHHEVMYRKCCANKYFIDLVDNWLIVCNTVTLKPRGMLNRNFCFSSGPYWAFDRLFNVNAWFHIPGDGVYYNVKGDTKFNYNLNWEKENLLPPISLTFSLFQSNAAHIRNIESIGYHKFTEGSTCSDASVIVLPKCTVTQILEYPMDPIQFILVVGV